MLANRCQLPSQDQRAFFIMHTLPAWACSGSGGASLWPVGPGWPFRVRHETNTKTDKPQGAKQKFAREADVIQMAEQWGRFLLSGDLRDALGALQEEDDMEGGSERRGAWEQGRRHRGTEGRGLTGRPLCVCPQPVSQNPSMAPCASRGHCRWHTAS